jgi:hypothetical protein
LTTTALNIFNDCILREAITVPSGIIMGRD